MGMACGGWTVERRGGRWRRAAPRRRRPRCSGKALDCLRRATHVLSTVPPDPEHDSDPVIMAHGQQLSEHADTFAWAGYISSTSGAGLGRGLGRGRVAGLLRVCVAAAPRHPAERARGWEATQRALLRHARLLLRSLAPNPPARPPAACLPPARPAAAVYGDWEGEWVDEESELRAAGGKGWSRVRAEHEWLALEQSFGLPAHIFRCGGIYGAC